MFSFKLSSIFFFFSAGLGRTAPDPSASVTLDGVQVPLGKGVHTNIDDTSLLYNEYPFQLSTGCMNFVIFLPNDPTFFLLCHLINHLESSVHIVSKFYVGWQFIYRQANVQLCSLFSMCHIPYH